MLGVIGLSIAVLPAPLQPSKTAQPVIVTGGTTANILYGKLQRGAQLPTTKLSPLPVAAVEDRSKLSSVLWSSFAMSSVPSGNWVDAAELPKMPRNMNSALVFIDGMTSEKKGGFQLPFGKKKAATDEAPPLDVATISAAASLGASHVYVLLDGDVAALDSCVDALKSVGSSDLCATIIAPASGVSLVSTPNWVQAPLQDHEGILSAGVSLSSGWDGEESKLIPTSGGGGPMAREDFAEIVFQVALRLPRAEAEGAPPLRVIRVAPEEGGDSSLVERPRQNYDSIIGGPKFRARLGTDASADWVSLLSPFGRVRQSDPNDFRLLLDYEVLMGAEFVPKAPPPKAARPPTPAAE